MSFEKESSLQGKEKEASQQREEDREIAERKDWRSFSGAILPWCRRCAAFFSSRLTDYASATSGNATALPVRSKYGDCAQPFS